MHAILTLSPMRVRTGGVPVPLDAVTAPTRVPRRRL